MAKARGRGVAVRVVDRAYRLLTRLGLGASYRHLLSVRGRRSGRVYTTPVDVMELDGRRWLVAAYGPGSWVKNARAAGEVVLSRGGRSRAYRVVEAEPSEAVAVLRRYLEEVRVARPYFDATPESPDEALLAELPRHPVLALDPQA
jgi:deazaflavin-dependent oxidoreductase (nitroreductase family)